MKSFPHAFRGFREAFSEPNFGVEVVIGILAIVASFVLSTSLADKEVIVLCIGLVLGTEAMNTAVEHLSDFVSPAHSSEIRIVKDLMAAAVLISSAAALAIGVIIFGNAIFHA